MDVAAQPGANAGADLNRTLDQLWARFLPDIRDRLSVLESAAAAAEANRLTSQQREEAHATAHKLAGILGTFGLMRGTELARRFEIEFSTEPGPDQNQGKALVATAAEIRAMIENRKSTA
jgi:HPt (histidine-containing phosphotransfer) domain-containing protein